VATAKGKFAALSPEQVAQMMALLKRVEAGDTTTALKELNSFVEAAGLGRVLGDLPAQAIDVMAKNLSGLPLQAVHQGVRERAEEVRKELAGPNPTPLEQLLAEAASVAWVHYFLLEHNSAGKQDQSLTVGLYYQKLLTESQKRYLRALRELATVREKLKGG
jgi:hypothetical protein